MKHSNLIQESNKMSIIRIAPVCDGKIYITPDMDLPIKEEVAHVNEKSDKTARKVLEKYRNHIHTDATPRFCAKHRSSTDAGATIYLYVLPLESEDEISFHEGRFVSEEEMNKEAKKYSADLLEESGLLFMSAELWEDFYLTCKSRRCKESSRGREACLATP